jgi:phosphatidylserine/phosphatidylglycerophosphate/cardiolipin synthase-like enzyme
MPRIFTAFSLLALFWYANSTSAQADIAEARSYDLGAAVSISGVVNCGAEMDDLRFMQDGSAGIGLKLDEAATGGWASIFGAAPAEGDGGGSGMHNKFVIIDADDAQNAWVLTGSGNWTTGNLISDCNNFIFFQDQSLALAYRLEFEEMWGGTTRAVKRLASSTIGSAPALNMGP